MLLILAAIIFLTLISCFLFRYTQNQYGFWGDVLGTFSLVLIGFSGSFMVLYIILGFAWFSAEYEVNIVNREYGTNYTQEEMFWAANVINTVRELKRDRIEVNGNLIDGACIPLK